MDLSNTLREERKSAELQPLDKNFYEQVGTYLDGLEAELSGTVDPYSVEAQILQDALKSERNSLSKLIDQRMRKIVRGALRRSLSNSKKGALRGLTEEEEHFQAQMVSAILQGREMIKSRVERIEGVKGEPLEKDGTEKPLTGRKDISQEYEIVRLLDSVPTFVGVNGKHYLLFKDDVVALPAVHARNLRNKSLADIVEIERWFK